MKGLPSGSGSGDSVDSNSLALRFPEARDEKDDDDRVPVELCVVGGS